MEDVLTEIPPPSRFYHEDLDIFALPSPPLPTPFLVFPNSKHAEPLRPSLLIVAVSSPSLYLFHHLKTKTLVGSLVLPESPFSGNSLEPSLHDKSCYIYALDGVDTDASIMLVSVQCPVSSGRAHIVSKLLIGERIVPQKVVVFDSVQRHNFRARLSNDDDAAIAFKLETSAERNSVGGGGGSDIRLEYFPSGSVFEGLGAALLSRCETRNIKATLCVTWPEAGSPVISLVKSLIKSVLPRLDLSFRGNGDDEFSLSNRAKNHPFDSELYT